MLLPAPAYPTVDGVEFGLAHQEGVVLRVNVLVVGCLREVEADAVVEGYRQKGAEFPRWLQAEEIGEVVRGLSAILRGDDGVVERDGHSIQ
jgi:hypothetical protein